jgi:ABC-type transport system substrate-binding protein
MIRTVDLKAQEGKVQQMVKYLYENAYALFIYAPISLYAVNKNVKFVPYKHPFLDLKETSVTENHWSLRAKTD